MKSGLNISFWTSSETTVKYYFKEKIKKKKSIMKAHLLLLP